VVGIEVGGGSRRSGEKEAGGLGRRQHPESPPAPARSLFLSLSRSKSPLGRKGLSWMIDPGRYTRQIIPNELSRNNHPTETLHFLWQQTFSDHEILDHRCAREYAHYFLCAMCSSSSSVYYIQVNVL